MFRHVLILSSLAATQVGAQTYYVSTTGNDASAGTSLAAPWRHIDFAVDKLRAGDRLEIRGGTYKEYVTMYSIVGTASAGITIRNYNNETVTISGSMEYNQTASWNKGYWVFSLQGCEYITVSGLNVDGRAWAGANKPADLGEYWRETGGFSIQNLTDSNNRYWPSRYITLINCSAVTCGGGGFGANYSSRVVFDTCTAKFCGTHSPYHCSGFSMGWLTNEASPDAGGWRNIIRNCVAYKNSEQNVATDHTDGNGIIIDGGNSGNAVHDGGTPLLITGCTATENGGRGITVFQYASVTINNCTTSGNLWDGQIRNAAPYGNGEVTVARSRNVAVLNTSMTASQAGAYTLHVTDSNNVNQSGNNHQGGNQYWANNTW